MPPLVAVAELVHVRQKLDKDRIVGGFFGGDIFPGQFEQGQHLGRPLLDEDASRTFLRSIACQASRNISSNPFRRPGARGKSGAGPHGICSIIIYRRAITRQEESDFHAAPCSFEKIDLGPEYRPMSPGCVAALLRGAGRTKRQKSALRIRQSTERQSFRLQASSDGLPTNRIFWIRIATTKTPTRIPHAQDNRLRRCFAAATENLPPRQSKSRAHEPRHGPTLTTLKTRPDNREHIRKCPSPFAQNTSETSYITGSNRLQSSAITRFRSRISGVRSMA